MSQINTEAKTADEFILSEYFRLLAENKSLRRINRMYKKRNNDKKDNQEVVSSGVTKVIPVQKLMYYYDNSLYSSTVFDALKSSKVLQTDAEKWYENKNWNAVVMVCQSKFNRNVKTRETTHKIVSPSEEGLVINYLVRSRYGRGGIEFKDVNGGTYSLYETKADILNWFNKEVLGYAERGLKDYLSKEFGVDVEEKKE